MIKTKKLDYAHALSRVLRTIWFDHDIPMESYKKIERVVKRNIGKEGFDIVVKSYTSK